MKRDIFGDGRGAPAHTLKRGGYLPLWLLMVCASSWLPGCADVSPSGGIELGEDASALRTHLYLPAGRAPHPLVIDLHGCSGIWAARNRVWIPRLNAAGFAVLQIDSLTLRGVTNICGDVFRVSPMRRTMDLASVMRKVLRDSRFEHDNIFLSGISHGATTSLLTQLHADSIFARLKGVIAFYPYCYDVLPVLNADLMVLIGELDDWTPVSRCRDMRVGDHNGHSYELVVYPGAYHSFDVPGLDESYYGHRVRYDAAAAEDSVRRVLRFLDRRRSGNSDPE